MSVGRDYAPQFQTKKRKTWRADLVEHLLGAAAYLISSYLFACAILEIPLW